MKSGFGYLLLLMGLVGFYSCQKCYQCRQYCAYCKSLTDTSVVYKTCSASDNSHYKVDSLKNVYQANGFNCSLLQADKKVCDQSTKINDAVNYYLLEDYYCVPR